MEAKTKKRLIVLGVIVAVIAVIVLLAFVLPGSKDTVANFGVSGQFVDESYQAYLDDNGFDGTIESVAVDVAVAEFEADERMSARIDSTVVDGETVTGVVVGLRGNITWNFNVEKEGFYNLKFRYASIDNSEKQKKNGAVPDTERTTTATPQRSVLLDGETMFDGMKQISFPRQWLNNEGEIANRKGNEIRPEATQIADGRVLEFFYSDENYRSLEPYAFYLSEGEHTLTLVQGKEPVKIVGISFEKADEPPTYEEYLAEHAGAPTYNGAVLTGQAERTGDIVTKIVKSNASIGMSSDYSSSYTYPYHHWNVLLNTLGGTSWQTPGDSVEWTINAPEDGLYQLSFRGRQSTNRGVKSFRQLKINVEVPFEEAKKVGFDFSGPFQNYVIANDGEPALFYLHKGENTISLDVCLGDFANAYTQINHAVQDLNSFYLKIVKITGTVPDTHIDYEIEDKIDGFRRTMRQQADNLNAIVDEMVEITGEKGSSTTNLEKIAQQAERFAANPERVVKEIGDFQSNISALSTWMLTIAEMPLEIDSITISAPGAKLKPAEPNGLIASYHEAIRFFATFVVDETQMDDTGNNKDALKVWTQTGRDQSNVIKNLIDSDFAPNKGIAVNLQLIPASVILPATLAGNGPDVALNMGQADIMNFAYRGALADLTQFSDFEEQKSRFFPSALQSVTYHGGVYGLPETQTFSMLFYREDILHELGLEPPKTWDDVGEMISELHINNYDFYMPSGLMINTMVYQNGGNLYHGSEGETYLDRDKNVVKDANGNEVVGIDTDYGIESGLRDEEAMIAFKRLCEFFTTYSLPVSADFSNRFRTGEIPIGVADYTTFNTLEIFAPEIKGLWNFAPLPGFKDANGNINNTAVSGSVHTTILNASKRHDDAWEFMKWWLDTNVQTSYAQTIEAIMGGGARYATANPDVLQALPWSATQADTLLAQFENTIGIPDVPGYYMTSRMVDYAYKNVVTDGQNPREALYLNVKEINDELTKKRKEFDLSYIEDGVYYAEGSEVSE